MQPSNPEPQREPAMPLAIDLTTFELRQRQNEWSRHGREDLAEAFRRIEVVVGGMK